MTSKIYLLIILFSVTWFACEKDLDIMDFKDEFGTYRPELKIEGILQQDTPANSIIRIIRTSLITDTDLYNGIDDDGDGTIDEEDETIAQVQDTSASVIVMNLNSGRETEFHYVAAADSSVQFEENEDGTEIRKIITYGGYKPDTTGFQIESFSRYQIEIYSRDFDKTITGSTTVYPSVQFIDTLFNYQDSLVFMQIEDVKEIFWKSDLAVTAYYITYEEIVPFDPGERKFEFVYSHAAARDHDLTKKYKTVSVGHEIFFGVYYPTIFKFTVEALSPEYGQYIFSELPLDDPQRSNLCDEDGNPVMGCFGASAAKSIFIVIEQ
jgi:hypothetical protein